MSRVYDRNNPADEARFQAELEAISRALVDAQIAIDACLAAKSAQKEDAPRPVAERPDA